MQNMQNMVSLKKYAEYALPTLLMIVRGVRVRVRRAAGEPESRARATGPSRRPSRTGAATVPPPARAAGRAIIWIVATADIGVFTDIGDKITRYHVPCHGHDIRLFV